MMHTHPVSAHALVAVELDGLAGDQDFLATHPAIHHVSPARDGGVVVWIDETLASQPAYGQDAPSRPPEVEMHGQGAPRAALADHPRAEHVEMFFDGLGHPQAAPRGWWHARVWLKAA